VDDHQGPLAFVHIFGIRATFLPVLVGGDGNQVILNLKDTAQLIDELDDGLLHLRALASELTDESEAQSGEHCCLVLHHLEVLVFVGYELLLVVPVDVPPLPNVNVRHLFPVNLVESQFVGVRVDEGVESVEGSKVHEVACVDGVVDAELFMDAEVPSPLFTLVLNVVRYQTPIMHYFSQATRIVDVSVGLKIFNISSKHLSEDES